MIERLRKLNTRRTGTASPFGAKSRQRGSLRRDSDGAPVLFEAVSQLPPFVESTLPETLRPVPPESDMSGAQPLSDGEAPGEGALGTRVMKGVSWTVVGTLWIQVLGIARTMALARLLSEEDFGIAALAMTVIGALYTLTNTGIVASVISSRFDSEEELHRYVNVVWTMEIGRGVLISALLLLVSYPCTLLYGEPRLLPILVALALTPLFTALQNTGLCLDSRHVELRSVTLHSLYSNSTAVLFTIFLAVVTRNYWALVWGQVLGALVTMGLSFVFSSYRPRLYWDKALSKRAFDFGKYLFVVGLADYALVMMDNVAVGYLYGKKVLGIYVVAYSFCTMARSLISKAFNAVLFPAFASAGREDDSSRLRNLVERSFTLGTLALTALITPLIVFAPAVLRIFYGTKWGSAVVPMRLLLLAGFFAGLMSLFEALFIGLDRPKLESKSKIYDALLFLAILSPLTLKLGAEGAALSGVVAWAGASMWRWKWANELVPGAFARLPYLLGSALVIGLTACALGTLPWAAAAGNWVKAFTTSIPSLGVAWTQFLLGAPGVLAFCTATFALLHPDARQELAGLKSKVMGKLKRG